MRKLNLVIAKVKGFPWWPAKVTDPAEQGLSAQKDKQFVYFYGTRKHAWVKCGGESVPFFENLTLVFEQKGKQDKIDAALQELEGDLVDPQDLKKFKTEIKVTDGSYHLPNMKLEASPSGESKVSGAKRKDPDTLSEASNGSRNGSPAVKEDSGPAKARAVEGKASSKVSKAQWIGKPHARSGDNRQFYNGFMKNSQSFKLGDCAYLNPEDDEEPYIIKIDSMFEQGGEMQVKGFWFYRPADAKKKPQDFLHNEVFLSDWADVNPVESVMQKANVLLRMEYPGSEAWAPGSELRKHFKHICCQTYSVRKNKLSPLRPEDLGSTADGFGARKANSNQDAMRQAVEGLRELAGRSSRPEHWVSLVNRVPWSGVQFINRQHRMESFQESTLTPKKGTGGVTCLSLSPNGETLAGVTLGGCLEVLEVASSQRKQQFVERGRGNYFFEYLCVTMTHDGSGCLVGGAQRDRNKMVRESSPPEHVVLGGFLKSFDLTKNECEAVQQIDVHKAPVNRIVSGWCADGGVCFSLSTDDMCVKLLYNENQRAYYKAGDLYCPNSGGMVLLYPPESEGNSDDSLKAHLLLIASGQGVKVYNVNTLEEVAAGNFTKLYQERCSDVALVPMKGWPSPTSEPVFNAADIAILTCGEDTTDGNAVVKLHRLTATLTDTKGPTLDWNVQIEEFRRYEMEASVVPLSNSFGCLCSNGRYAMRAVGTQLYVWNLDTQQLTAIVQHENGSTFSCTAIHPTQKLMYLGTTSGEIEAFRQSHQKSP